MNAIPPSPPSPDEAAARTARHLAMLEELATIGMALARALGEQALRALDPPAPGAPADPPPGRGDPTLAFTRIARAVRQTIALEARIVAGEAGMPRRRPNRPEPDPRRDLIRRLLRQAAEADGAPRGARDREIEERLADELDADPEAEVPIEEIFAAIREDLGIGLDLARQSDEVLAMIIAAEPPEPDAEAEVGPAAQPAPPSRPSGPDPP